MEKSTSQREQGLRAEHRVLWTSKESPALPAHLHALKGFFARFARATFREFPWRRPGINLFHLLLAEMLLVQTKADDVARVWPRLIRRFDTPAKLSRASHSTVMSLLQPLGLQKQRADALIAVSRTLRDRHAGIVPEALEALLSLPHVGLYIATAIASFGFGQRVPIVDANVVRVLDRVTGGHGSRELRRRPDIWRLAWALLPKRDPAKHNYGFLDFAATVCKSRTPHCPRCELLQLCAYGQQRRLVPDDRNTICR
jgi:A/G-specific adenine glycosylase